MGRAPLSTVTNYDFMVVVLRALKGRLVVFLADGTALSNANDEILWSPYRVRPGERGTTIKIVLG